MRVDSLLKLLGFEFFKIGSIDKFWFNKLHFSFPKSRIVWFNMHVMAGSFIHFQTCEMEIFYFLCLIWNNYLPKAPTKNNVTITPIATPHPHLRPAHKTSTKKVHLRSAILTKFTYMLKKSLENNIVNFWTFHEG